MDPIGQFMCAEHFPPPGRGREASSRDTTLENRRQHFAVGACLIMMFNPLQHLLVPSFPPALSLIFPISTIRMQPGSAKPKLRAGCVRRIGGYVTIRRSAVSRFKRDTRPPGNPAPKTPHLFLLPLTGLRKIWIGVKAKLLAATPNHPSRKTKDALIATPPRSIQME